MTLQTEKKPALTIFTPLNFTYTSCRNLTCRTTLQPLPLPNGHSRKDVRARKPLHLMLNCHPKRAHVASRQLFRSDSFVPLCGKT